MRTIDKHKDPDVRIYETFKRGGRIPETRAADLRPRTLRNIDVAELMGLTRQSVYRREHDALLKLAAGVDADPVLRPFLRGSDREVRSHLHEIGGAA